MGTYTLSSADTSRLFWLGRYVERTYTTMIATGEMYDKSIDGDGQEYVEYCRMLGIPNCYKDLKDFIWNYLRDKNNPASIISSIGYAMDNGVLVRQAIGSQTLSYIQMAQDYIEKACTSDTPRVVLTQARDCIMAFRGSCEENIDDMICRNLIKTGCSMERVDLYLRLGYDKTQTVKELNRLLNRLYKSKLPCSAGPLNKLLDSVLTDGQNGISMTREEQIQCVESIFAGI